METRYAEGKALWKKNIWPHFVQDAESGINAVLDWLEDAGKTRLGLDTFTHLYGENGYADAPVRIGNNEYGITVRNRVGLAPGFTKDGRGLTALDATGLGLIGIGTIPWHAQPGNPKPRCFVECRAEDLLVVVNRFGFNAEEGIDGPIRRVEEIWKTRGRHSIKASLVWSVGPNKSTMEQYETSKNLRLIARDIVCSIIRIIPVLRGNDAVAFNVTSPNTPGLRDLLERFEELLAIIFVDLRDLARIYWMRVPPCIIKLSPDMPDEQMRQVAKAKARYKEIIAFEGFNTTVDERIRMLYNISESGGISGDPLRQLAPEKLISLCRILDEEGIDADVIGVGGIRKSIHALTRLRIAPRVKTIQFLSGMFTESLTLVSELLETIALNL
ncbi:MAG: hypothetical protein HYT41_01760 [Candidatus Sungbacteria bacterium]|nr:hypothetical protein [Candidatus Sungbacteria bacterium]